MKNLCIYFILICIFISLSGCQSKEEKAGDIVSAADKLVETGELEEAIVQYKIAYELFSDDSIQAKIVLAEKENVLQHAKDLLSQEEYQLAYDLLIDLNNYKNSDELLESATYNVAIIKYNDGFFNDAKELFEKNEQYKDTVSYLENINILKNFQGTWEKLLSFTPNSNINDKQIIVINGWDLQLFSIKGGKVLSDRTSKYILEDEEIVTTTMNFRFYWANVPAGKFIREQNVKSLGFIQISDKPEKVESIKDPNIGMTSDEVIKSTWGKPIDINRTTTKYGTSEQWVYSNYRYIYLDDGIVTAIQD